MVSIISASAGILSIIISLLIYFKSRRFKALSYSIKSFEILNDDISSIPGFKAEYKDEAINNLTVSKLYIWNSGNDIIENSDFSEIDNLRLKLPNNTDILYSNLLAQSKNTNQCKCNKSKNTLIINFDYFEKNQGAVFTLLYCLPKETEGKVKLEGTLKNGKISNKTDGSSNKYINFIFDTLPLFLVILTIQLITYLASLVNFPKWLEWIIGILVFMIISGIIQKLINKIRGFIEDRFLGKLNTIYSQDLSSKDFA